MPIKKRTAIAANAYLKSPVIPTTDENNKGPANAVAFPEKAKKPVEDTGAVALEVYRWR